MAMYSEFTHFKIMIFHSYVKLPEGSGFTTLQDNIEINHLLSVSLGRCPEFSEITAARLWASFDVLQA